MKHVFIILFLLLPFLSKAQCLLEVERINDKEFILPSTGFEVQTPHQLTGFFNTQSLQCVQNGIRGDGEQDLKYSTSHSYMP